MSLETKAYFPFEIQLSLGVHWGLVPGTSLGTKICQCSSALVWPSMSVVPHPQIEPPVVFDLRLVQSADEDPVDTEV